MQIDTEDYNKLIKPNKIEWLAMPNYGVFTQGKIPTLIPYEIQPPQPPYSNTDVEYMQLKLPRLIMKAAYPSQKVIHINGNLLDCRKDNLNITVSLDPDKFPTDQTIWRLKKQMYISTKNHLANTEAE